MIPWLHRPYPFEEDAPSALRTSVVSGLFIWLFLYLFRPFGTQIPADYEWNYLGTCFLFGLVTALTILLVHGATRLFPRIFKDEGWTVGKEILFSIGFISCIGFGNFILAHFLFDVPLTWLMALKWQGVTFAVGLLPATMGAFYSQLKKERRYAAEAANISQRIDFQSNKNETAADATAEWVVLTGENQQETLRLPARQIVYLAAADNYVQVFYWEENSVKNRMLRATMKKMEDALASYPEFFRCHRTYLVHLEKVRSVSGNAQGYRLHLEGVAGGIPVSRNLNDAIRERFQLGEKIGNNE